MHSVWSWEYSKAKLSANTERLGYGFVAVVVTALTQLLTLGNGVSQGLVFYFFSHLHLAGLTRSVFVVF